jgi:hypothetical protein
MAELKPKRELAPTYERPQPLQRSHSCRPREVAASGRCSPQLRRSGSPLPAQKQSSQRASRLPPRWRCDLRSSSYLVMGAGRFVPGTVRIPRIQVASARAGKGGAVDSGVDHCGHGGGTCPRGIPQGLREARYAAIATMSSMVSRATGSFISTADGPERVPCWKSTSWRTR